jgi:hypothetical protein
MMEQAVFRTMEGSAKRLLNQGGRERDGSVRAVASMLPGIVTPRHLVGSLETGKQADLVIPRALDSVRKLRDIVVEGKPGRPAVRVHSELGSISVPRHRQWRSAAYVREQRVCGRCYEVTAQAGL